MTDHYLQREHTGKPRRRLVALLLAVVMLTCFAACTPVQRYHVDYQGQKDSYTGAKDTYPAGAKVRLYYEIWATDTDYYFYLDDELLDNRWDEKHGFVLEFTMPAHDVTLRCEMVNSMEYDPTCSNPMEAVMAVEFVRLDVDGASRDGYTIQVCEPEEGKEKVLVDSADVHDIYTVDEKLLEDLFTIAEDAGMEDWMYDFEANEYQKAGTYTFRSMLWFIGEDVFYADIACMPEDGDAVFDQIEERLWQDLDEAHLTEHTAW